jgi:hypothetical protein
MPQFAPPRLRRSAIAVLAAMLACACSSDGADSAANGRDGAVDDAAAAVDCERGEVAHRGRCVDPMRRYEPEERIDFDNVVSYRPAQTVLDLPDPPRSGFRLIVPPRILEPGAEVVDCHAWAYPEITHRNIYAARVYTNGGLHHSNLYGVPLASSGPSPYPRCAPGQASVADQLMNLLSGDIMDVLFANSTQIADGEQVVFPAGMAFKLKTEGREATTSIHWLNTNDEPLRSEIVYDFFTMPDEDVETELVPFVFETENIAVPAGTTGDVTTTCDLTAPGHIVSIMPHTHKRTVAFDVELLRADGSAESIFHDGNFDTESDITVFEDAIDLDGFSRIRHSCTIRNDLDREIVWGIGDDEMCTLFGYLYPPSAQQLGYVARNTSVCTTFDLGSARD